MAEAIAISGLSHAFGATKALKSISLSVPRAASFALLGPNGAGKTTLISILCTLLKPQAGKVELAGIDVARRPTAARRSIGVVFQDSSLDDRLSGWENLEFHGLVYGLSRARRAARIAEVFKLVDLTDWAEQPVRSYSGGMKRRLEIARALMHQPQILFLDEPTVGLDAQTRAGIWAYLDRLRHQTGLTILITTHYIDEVEGCDQVCIIDKGEILADGTPLSLKEAHGVTVLHATPRDSAAAEAILASYPAATRLEAGRLAIPGLGAGEVDDFLARFGSGLREIRLDQPSLESVFLKLTGRELRDPAAPQVIGRKGARG